MGRFDKENQEDSNWQRTKNLLKIMFVVIGFALVIFLFTSGEKVEQVDKICSEIRSMMLDDPDHMRLHNTYPTLMNDLHLYIDKNCETVEESESGFNENPMDEMDDGNGINIGVGFK